MEIHLSDKMSRWRQIVYVSTNHCLQRQIFLAVQSGNVCRIRPLCLVKASEYVTQDTKCVKQRLSHMPFVISFSLLNVARLCGAGRHSELRKAETLVLRL